MITLYSVLTFLGKKCRLRNISFFNHQGEESMSKRKIHQQRKKGVVYTCFTKGYDELIQHRFTQKSFDYICFTDDEDLIQQKQVGIWQIRPMLFKELDDARNIRWYKILPHKALSEYDLSIWVDTNINVLTPKLFNFTDDTLKEGMLFPKHHTRDCVYRECARVLELKKDTYQNVIKMVELLVDQNMPKHYGMNEANILIRKHNDAKVQKIMEDWWYMVTHYSRRDQLSLSYVLWRNGIHPADIAFDNARTDVNNFCFESHKTDLPLKKESL